MELERRRPGWHVRVYETALALILLGKIAEGIVLRRDLVWAGELFTARSLLPPAALGSLAGWMFWALTAVQLVLIAAVVARRAVRPAALLIAATMTADLLVAFQNHRLLMILMWLFVAAHAPPERRAGGPAEADVYLGMDLLRWQITLVYLFAALHKLVNPRFMSGEGLQAMFEQLRAAHGLYPDALFALLREPTACAAMAWATVGVELLLAVGLHRRRTAGACIALAIAMHVSFALLMVHIEVFTAMMIAAQLAFVPFEPRDEQALVLERRAPDEGPRRWLRLLYPGLVRVDEAPHPELAAPWRLRAPDGAVLVGREAWLALLRRSPLTVLLAPLAGSFLRRAPEPRS